MSLSSRVQSDLVAQHQRLREEFATWRGRATAHGDLAQHHSQVERTTHTLEGMLDKITAGSALADGASPATASLDMVMQLRHNLGTVHLVWDFFRDKFAQRDTGLFQHHLGAADDLAWCCYKPFLDATVAATVAADQLADFHPEDLKEPPLLFYSSDRSPFAQARSSAFRPLGLSPRDIEMSRQVLLRLPVPVIGMPWSQARDVPSLVFVGHEAGHVVAEDLGLARSFETLIDGLDLPADRTRVWKSWADETFADVFGVLATGSAYVERLSHELADSLQVIRGQTIDRDKPGAYPTAALRVALCQQVQTRLGLGIDTAWQQTYRSPSGDSFAFAQDVAPVAEVLLAGPYPTLGGKGLAEILPWTPTHDTKTATVAEDVLAGANPPIPFDLRIWIAAAVRAQNDDPERYARRQLDTRLAETIVAKREDGVRSVAHATLRHQVVTIRGIDAPGAPGAPGPSMKALDWQKGTEVADLLFGATGE